MNYRVWQAAAFDSLCIAGHLPSSFLLTRRAFDSLSALAPGNLPSIRNKGSARGGRGARCSWNRLTHKSSKCKELAFGAREGTLYI